MGSLRIHPIAKTREKISGTSRAKPELENVQRQDDSLKQRRDVKGSFVFLVAAKEGYNGGHPRRTGDLIRILRETSNNGERELTGATRGKKKLVTEAPTKGGNAPATQLSRLTGGRECARKKKKDVWNEQGARMEPMLGAMPKVLGNNSKM